VKDWLIKQNGALLLDFSFFFSWHNHKRGLDRNASMEWIRRPTACNASSRRWNSPWNPAVHPWVILEGVFAATASFLARRIIASTFCIGSRIGSRSGHVGRSWPRSIPLRYSVRQGRKWLDGHRRLHHMVRAPRAAARGSTRSGRHQTPVEDSSARAC
jgi:hypothetical protein